MRFFQAALVLGMMFPIEAQAGARDRERIEELEQRLDKQAALDAIREREEADKNYDLMELIGAQNKQAEQIKVLEDKVASLQPTSVVFSGPYRPDLTIEGSVDRALVAQVIDKNKASLGRCFEQGWIRADEEHEHGGEPMSGSVVRSGNVLIDVQADGTIAPRQPNGNQYGMAVAKGNVNFVGVDFSAPPVEGSGAMRDIVCLEEIIGGGRNHPGWRFPASANGQPYRISWWYTAPRN